MEATQSAYYNSTGLINVFNIDDLAWEICGEWAYIADIQALRCTSRAICAAVSRGCDGMWRELQTDYCNVTIYRTAQIENGAFTCVIDAVDAACALGGTENWDVCGDYNYIEQSGTFVLAKCNKHDDVVVVMRAHGGCIRSYTTAALVLSLPEDTDADGDYSDEWRHERTYAMCTTYLFHNLSTYIYDAIDIALGQFDPPAHIAIIDDTTGDSISQLLSAKLKIKEITAGELRNVMMSDEVVGIIDTIDADCEQCPLFC